MNGKDLIRKCQLGQKSAFDELIRLYYDYVFGFLLKATADQMLTEDLTQETFLKMINNIEKYNLGGNASFGTWLIAIAKNCYKDHLRRNRIYLEDIDNLAIEDQHNLADETDRKIQYEQLLEVIDTLPRQQAMAIKLKYIEDMTLAQIAEKFGVEPKTIKSRIHDGTVKLRKKLKIRERMGNI